MKRRWIGPPRQSVSRAPSLGSGLVYLVAALALTWPLASHLTTHIPRGTEPVGTVQQFNLWTMEWNADRIAHGYSDYWDAPIFHPAGGTFALSDPQPLTGGAYFLARTLTRDPALAYNLIVLGALTFNALAMRRLLGRLGVPDGAAVLAGLLGLALPFVIHELGVLQLIAIFPILCTITALIDFARSPSSLRGLAIGAWIAVSFLTSTYYGVFLVVAIPLVAIGLARRKHLNWRTARSLLGGIVFFAVVAGPFLLAQRANSQGHARSTDAVTRNSAQIADYMELDPSWPGSGAPWMLDDVGGSQRLGVSSAILLLAAIGAVAGLRRGVRRRTLLQISGIAFAFTVSLGLNFVIAGWYPYEFARDHLDVIARLRSPFRFVVMAQLGMVVLAGSGIGWLWNQRIQRGPLRIGRFAACVLVGLSLFEVTAMPAELTRVPPVEVGSGWVDWLRSQPPGGVALIPFPSSGSVHDYESTTTAMLATLDVKHPLANGYSGFFPDEYDEIRDVAKGFPTPKTIAVLRNNSIEYVVMEWSWHREHADSLGRLGTRALEVRYEDDAYVVFTIKPQ